MHIKNRIICFGFKKTNREISTAGGDVIYLFYTIYLNTIFHDCHISFLDLFKHWRGLWPKLSLYNKFLKE